MKRASAASRLNEAMRGVLFVSLTHILFEPTGTPHPPWVCLFVLCKCAKCECSSACSCVSLSVFLSLYLSVCLGFTVCLSVCLPACLPACLPVCLSLCPLKCVRACMRRWVGVGVRVLVVGQCVICWHLAASQLDPGAERGCRRVLVEDRACAS